MNQSLQEKEIKSFSNLWKGGYFEGDPLNPIATSGYAQFGFISTLYATYLLCIKPYINSESVALEIGPGRGAWTKAMLPAKEIYALDALSAEHNGFFEYLPPSEHVKYFQVDDFSCKMLPENHFSYMFSFGCLCHVSFEGITQYAVNIYPKLKSGAHCFWLVADYEKYNYAVNNLHLFNFEQTVIPKRRRYFLFRLLLSLYTKRKRHKVLSMDEDNQPSSSGRWYNAGVLRTCAMLEKIGYKIIEPDVEVNMRDPIIHFIKS
ncbi:MAG: class I SAM-dependent methyltransferase [Oscillospiraceae bacterium]|jgi:hypothetical protein|nr:class I SAM-dependent methyltransferase [Oscillospiraceae bacterium]